MQAQRLIGGALAIATTGAVGAFALRDRGWRAADHGHDSLVDSDHDKLVAGREKLLESPTGREILEQLDRRRARLTIVDDAAWLASRHKNQGGQYQFWNDEILIRRSRLDIAPERTALLIAHEGAHMLDARGDIADVVSGAVRGAIEGVASGWRSGSGLGDRISAAASGVLSGGKHGSADGLAILEAEKYAIQRQVADELGYPDTSHATDPETGEARSAEEIRRSLANSETYTSLPERHRPANAPVVVDAENSFVFGSGPTGIKHVRHLDGERVNPRRG